MVSVARSLPSGGQSLCLGLCVFRGAVGSGSFCLLMDGAVLPPLLVWLVVPQPWSLQPAQVRSWCCNGCLPESSRQMNIPSTSVTSVLTSTVGQSRPPPPQETFLNQQVGSRVAALPQVPGHMRPCVPSRSGVCAPLQSCRALHSSPADLQSQMLWGLLLPRPNSQAEEHDMGLRTLISVGESLQYFPVCRVPPPQGSRGLIIL